MDERTLLQDAPLVVIDVDPALRVSGWNRRAEQTFKTSQEAALGRKLEELLPLHGAADKWTSLFENGAESRVWELRGAGDQPLLFEAWWQVDRGEDGSPRGARLFGHDATSRVTVERRAVLESAMLQAIKEHLDIALWAVDGQGTFLYQDGKGVRATGMQPHQFVGQNIFEAYREGGDLDGVRRALKGEAISALPAEVHGMHWQTWYIPMQENAADAAVVGITLDVTEARRSEIELRTKLELIERQQEVIRELSTPIIEVWDGVLTLPIIGLVDSVRTAEIMDNLLTSVATTRARYAILDLTGVEVVDTGTAGHLIGMIQAIRLLGAEGILTGIHPTIAQTIVALGVDLARVAVFAKLRDALKFCIVQMSQRKPTTTAAAAKK
ncbi:STAS domain-containing protein [Nannocystis bainbridge]|uniref:PAS domain-containing protein n=1 Tax=Nannocystis bainbridge TaxID=2995303 RepID=A0ABT5E828_9BACT|nr:STAS domain-containing protein [Nannocystis bainbridge]MDC0722017.1 PAS domain-containing protein [Nannocystis bainbridge]